MSRLATAAEEYPFAFFGVSALLFTAVLYLDHFGFMDYSAASSAVRVAALLGSALPMLYLLGSSDHDPFDLVVPAFTTSGVCFALVYLRLSLRPEVPSTATLVPWSAELLFFQIAIASVTMLGIAALAWVFVGAIDRVAARMGVTA